MQVSFHELTNQQGFTDHHLATASVGKITLGDVSSYFQLLPAQEKHEITGSEEALAPPAPAHQQVALRRGMACECSGKGDLASRYWGNTQTSK